MGDDTRHRSRRWLLAAGLAGVLIVVAVVVLKEVVFRDQARAVTTDEAVNRYRAEASTVPPTTSTPSPTTSTTVAATTPSTMTSPPTTETTTTENSTSTAAPSAPVALVASGVYRYTTTGQEHVDALNGTTHAYPAETTITVVPDGCGASLRWDALKERWDQWHLCATANGVELETDGIQYHEFFGQPDNEAVACEAPVTLIPAIPAVTPPPPQQQTCTLAADPWLPLWTILERTTRTVDGRPVDVQHVQMQIQDDDQYWEHTTIDWYLALDGLPVQVVSTKSSLSASPIGAIQYDEHYELDLESLTPLT